MQMRDSKPFRDRADELRAIAETVTDLPTKYQLELLANQYDRIAQRVSSTAEKTEPLR